MSERAVTHSTFSIERSFPDASPRWVYRAFADPAAKARWFQGPPGWRQDRREQDFREGGGERVAGTFPDGSMSDFDARYLDIVAGERIVYSYVMFHGGKRLSVSLATIEFLPEGKGTRLIITEQGAYFDGPAGAASREQGTKWLLERVAATLEPEPAGANA